MQATDVNGTEQASSSGESSSTTETLASAATGHRARILVADDHLTEREYVRTVLGYAGYEVLEASDGETALAIIASARPDIVITDILMPKLDGLELVRQIRQQPAIADTRVIVWSATFRQQEARTITTALGVSHLLQKPVEPHVLLSAVNDVLLAPAPAHVQEDILVRLEAAHQRLLNDKLYKKTLELEAEIAARQQIEAALRESQRRMTGLVESAMDAIISIDADQRVVLFNGAAEVLFGCRAEGAIGTAIDRFIPARFRVEHADHVRQFATTGTTSRAMGRLGTLWGLRTSGEEFPIEASISKVQVEGQWQFTVILRDITDRKRAEEALRQQAMLLDLAPDPILVWEGDKRIVFWNHACQALYGYSPEEAIGKSSHELLKTVFPGGVESCQAALADTGEWSGELRQTTRNGDLMVVSTHMQRVRLDGREVTLEANRDITDKKQLEDALQQLNADLECRVAERTAELSRSNEALLKSNQELRRFAYVASHDLQTPLRAIAGFSQLLQKRYGHHLDSGGHDLFRRIVEAARRLQVLIHDLLDYSRVDAQPHPFGHSDLGEIYQRVVESLEESIRSKGAEITHGKLPTVWGDRGQLAQLLQNLVENALKYQSVEPPRIRVEAVQEGDEWRISVRDNGIGIAPEQHERVFELFRRLHSPNAYPGTGIGLAICRRVVERHGGRIWVESEPGQGSTFHFTLPFCKDNPS